MTVNVKRKENQHYLKLKIEDTGIGMEALFSENLFSLLTNTKSKDGINKNGMGLGLTICK